MGSGTQWKIHCCFFGGLDSRFLHGVERSFPDQRKGLAKRKVKSGDCVQDFLTKRFSRNGGKRHAGECAAVCANYLKTTNARTKGIGGLSVLL